MSCRLLYNRASCASPTLHFDKDFIFIFDSQYQTTTDNAKPLPIVRTGPLLFFAAIHWRHVLLQRLTPAS